MGLGVSTGRPMGVIAAAGMPIACLTAGTRKAAFKSTLGYYVAGIWPTVPGLDRYLGQATALRGCAKLFHLPYFLAVNS
jgi:hypothetical protein